MAFGPCLCGGCRACMRAQGWEQDDGPEPETLMLFGAERLGPPEAWPCEDCYELVCRCEPEPDKRGERQ